MQADFTRSPITAGKRNLRSKNNKENLIAGCGETQRLKCFKRYLSNKVESKYRRIQLVEYLSIPRVDLLVFFVNSMHAHLQNSEMKMYSLSSCHLMILSHRSIDPVFIYYYFFFFFAKIAQDKCFFLFIACSHFLDVPLGFHDL